MKDRIYFPDTQRQAEEAARQANIRHDYSNQELPEVERIARINMIKKSWGLEPQSE